MSASADRHIFVFDEPLGVKTNIGLFIIRGRPAIVDLPRRAFMAPGLVGILPGQRNPRIGPAQTDKASGFS
jgi:hypothetical protein